MEALEQLSVTCKRPSHSHALLAAHHALSPPLSPTSLPTFSPSRLSAMWLDRFSNQNTPSGTPPPRGSSYSPAPRRSYAAAGPGPLPPRPSLNPRSSSLSLISAASSSSSLPSTARLPNGAGRRRQGPGGVPPNVPDPLQVLETILGGPPRRPVGGEAASSAGQAAEKPEHVVDDIDFGGLSLQGFAERSSHEQEPRTPAHTYNAHSVEECIYRPTILSLHLLISSR